MRCDILSGFFLEKSDGRFWNESGRGHVMKWLKGSCVLLLTLGITAQAAGQDSVAASPRYLSAARAISRLIDHEMRDKKIPAISIAVMDSGRIVWARGFGLARPDSIPATASTIYRVGTLSDLVTDLVVLQEADNGRLALDAPVRQYLPEFHPEGNSAAITVRHLLTHRSGLVREPPVGGSSDSRPTTLSQVVESLNRTSLLSSPGESQGFRPGDRMVLSNSGIAVLGYLLERVAAHPFAQLMTERVFNPLGMAASSFTATPGGQRWAQGTMRTVDGRRFPAPVFSQGIAPAAGLSSTVIDLAHLLNGLMPSDSGRPMLSAGSLQQLEIAQRSSRGDKRDGAFRQEMRKLNQVRILRNVGEAPGYSIAVDAHTDGGPGVVVASNLDQSSAVLSRIADFTIEAAVAARRGNPIPEPIMTTPAELSSRHGIVGHYSGIADLEIRGRMGDLELLYSGGVPRMLRSRGDTLIVDDALGFGAQLLQQDSNSITLIGSGSFPRRYEPRPPPVARQWAPLIGEYGWDYNNLYVLEDHGELHVLIDWFSMGSLAERSEASFEVLDSDRYAGERIVFRKGHDGKVEGLSLSGRYFPRRSVGPSDGSQLKITPVRPVPDLIREALDATPPSQPPGLRAPDLVELATLDSTIHYEIRYATTNNFAGTVFYPEAHAFMQRPAALALLRAHQWLKGQGYGLLIHDAYRPWYVTKSFWDAVPDSIHWLVANPANGSRHNRGAAVDLTLYDLRTGQPVEMTGTYDESTPRSFSDYPGGTSLQRWHRELLRRAMETQDFFVNPEEWWHFDYKDWREYPVLNLRFDQLRR
ncbi:MAG: serine hydrolase [Gemmatimonadota bacterium]